MNELSSALVGGVAAPPQMSTPQRAERAAKEFEAAIIAQLLAPIFDSVQTPAIAGGGQGQDFFQTMLEEHYAKAIVERGGFGIADHVKSALIDIQARQHSTPQGEGAQQ